MPDIVLGERQQDSLRRLLALEATPGSLPPGVLLDIVDRLVPSDCIVVSLSDSTGCVVDHVMLLRQRPCPRTTRRCAMDRSCSDWCTRGPHPVERRDAAPLRRHRRRHARLQVRTGPCRPALDGSLRPDVLGGRPGDAADDHPRAPATAAHDPDDRPACLPHPDRATRPPAPRDRPVELRHRCRPLRLRGDGAQAPRARLSQAGRAQQDGRRGGVRRGACRRGPSRRSWWTNTPDGVYPAAHAGRFDS